MGGKLHVLAMLLVTPLVTAPSQGTPPISAEVSRLLDKIGTGLEYEQSGDPEPARRLAALFAEGRGVEQDAALACTFATQAGMVTATTWPRGESHEAMHARHREAEKFTERYCSGLSATELKGAHEAFGCFAIGMPTEILSLDGVSILVDRTGIGILDRPLRIGFPNCPVVVSSVRAASAMPAFGATAQLRPRQFVEALYWIRAGRVERPTFMLHLYLQELIDGRLEPVLFERLLESTTWPDRHLDLRSWYDLHPDGRVRYEVAGAAEKRGWVKERAR